MRYILAVLAAISPLPALALSCMPHSLETSYVEAAEAEETYVVVQGRLTFDAQDLPEVDMQNQQDTPPMTMIDGRLEGMSMTRSGFDVPFEQDVTIALECYGPWCAQAQTGQDVLAFLRKDDDAYVIATNPCGGMLFTTPDAAMIDKVQACFAGETCEPESR
jgi:hypothetical protein